MLDPMIRAEADLRHLQEQCRRFGLSAEGSVDDLLDRIQNYVQSKPTLEGSAHLAATRRRRGGPLPLGSPASAPHACSQLVDRRWAPSRYARGCAERSKTDYDSPVRPRRMRR